MKNLLRILGRRLRELRERSGVSQEDFADRCGLHRTAVGLLERGKRMPRLDTLLIIGNGLGIQLTKIVHGIERRGKIGPKIRPASKAKRRR